MRVFNIFNYFFVRSILNIEPNKVQEMLRHSFQDIFAIDNRTDVRYNKLSLH